MINKALLFLVTGMLGWQISLASEEINPAVMVAMEKVIPGLKPDSIRHSPIAGLYELEFGPHVIYVTKDGRYMVRGDVFDLAKGENLTEGKRKQARLKAVEGLGEDSMIVFAPKDPKYTVTVFTDITCPYCQKMHSQMKEMNALGIKVRYLAFPRAGIPSKPYDDMVSVWCADDPQQAMTDAKAGKSVTPKRCDNPIAEHYKMGQMVGVKGTPTIILENGDTVPGYSPPQRLIQMLETGKTGLARR